MANSCTTFLYVTGNPALIKKLSEEAMDNRCFLSKYERRYAEILEVGRLGDVRHSKRNYPKKGGEFYTTIHTSWDPPLKNIEKLSESFQRLNFHVAWEEAGVGIYGEAFFNGKDKIKIIKDLDACTYYCTHREDVLEEIDFVRDNEYEVILKELIDNGLDGIEHHPAFYAQVEYARKIIPVDIPLIINLDWIPEAMRVLRSKLE